MLGSMVGRADGPSDQLTTVTHAITGAYYVIPSAERLAAFSTDAQD
jgi:deferrochelatase/peroxidase EfeB